MTKTTRENNKKEAFPVCPYKERCYFRTIFGDCSILTDTSFSDSKCHFRKETYTGKNMYDAERKANK